MAIIAYLELVGKSILTYCGIQALSLLMGGFGILCWMLGWGAVKAILDHVKEKQPIGDRISFILILGPLYALFAFLGIGLAVLSFLTIPGLYFAWLGTPDFIQNAITWLALPTVASVTTDGSIILLWLLFELFALGVSFTFLRSIPMMLGKLRTLGDFIGVIFALAIGLAFLFIGFMLVQSMWTHTFGNLYGKLSGNHVTWQIPNWETI